MDMNEWNKIKIKWFLYNVQIVLSFIGQNKSKLRQMLQHPDGINVENLEQRS